MMEFLALRAGELDLALELASVKEVIRAPAIVSVPNLPASVSGVINFRGVAIPVVDLRERFGSSAGAGEARISAPRLVICAVGSKVVAFAVDDAREIVRVERDSIEPCESDELAGVVLGAVPHRNQRLVWLDPQALLASDRTLSVDELRNSRKASKENPV